MAVSDPKSNPLHFSHACFPQSIFCRRPAAPRLGGTRTGLDRSGSGGHAGRLQRCLEQPLLSGGGADNTLYTSFAERPKRLDPARSYTSDEAEFTAQVYEPPFQYHYLKRPYELIPAAALSVPKPRYYDKAGKELPDSAAVAEIATSVYDIRIRPAFAMRRIRRRGRQPQAWP